jgi:hypothetical protein
MNTLRLQHVTLRLDEEFQAITDVVSSTILAVYALR